MDDTELLRQLLAQLGGIPLLGKAKELEPDLPRKMPRPHLIRRPPTRARGQVGLREDGGRVKESKGACMTLQGWVFCVVK